MWDWVFDSKGLHPQSLTEIVILMVECLFVASSVDFRLDTQSSFMRLLAIEKTNYNLFDFLTMRVYVPLLEYTQYLREGIRDMRLLLVEDDLKIAFFVKTGLEESGFAVDHAEDGEDGLHLALTEPYDLCIIDIMLPKIDGLTIISELRRKHINTPMLILSAKRSVDDRVKGLKTGGDDYLIKPFAFSELLARVQALLRRAGGVSSPSSFTVSDLTVNVHTHKVVRAGKDIDLQPLEFSLLEYLIRNAGQVVSKTMIMEHVWDYNFNPQTNIVESRICYLRDKIDRGFDRKLIHTVRGVGYVLRLQRSQELTHICS